MSTAPLAAPGRSQIQAYLSLLPEPERALLKRCALLDSFDDQITNELARDIGPGAGVTLKDLTEYPFVHKVRGRPGFYRLRDDMRRELLESWWAGQPPDSVPTELSALSTHLARWLEKAPGADPDEVVGLRLFADVPDALNQWKVLYAAADKQFDLVRCQSLLGRLTWMAAVSPKIEEAREYFETYADARSFWTDEWYRTASFLPPTASIDALKSLLKGKHGRMLELRGFPGYGKTTHIRWLIARHCAPKHIPCARIDFDEIDPLAATRDPYLVLLDMADQLDRQLPGDAFGKLVRTYSTDRVRLYRRERATRARPPNPQDAADTELRSAAAEEVLRRFGSRLAEIPPDKPVVLILDTLEVPLHHPDTAKGPAIKPLAAALAAVQRQAPCVRILLAGRYSISDDVRELFQERRDRYELPKFSKEEARAYLIDKRQVQRGDHVDAAVQASERVPFSLALLADLIDEEPSISPHKIAEYRGAEYAYLIEKVVKRIKEQPVRWVLRYAAIPRRFDYEFVRDVLWPHIREEMGGIRSRDNPAADNLPREELEGEALWAVGELPAAGEETVWQVWEQVRRYASGSSWIGPDKRDTDALRLQAEVVHPLRELLRGKEIVPVLHSDAVRYYLRRAAEANTPGADNSPGGVPRDRRGEFLREAVFHRFQFEGEAAGAWWQEQIAAADSAVVRLALADELARQPDYSQLRRPARRGAEGTLVSEQTLQQARLELCLASAELATLEVSPPERAALSPPHVLWQDAADALERLEAFPVDALPSGRVALARAAVHIGTLRSGPVADDVREALEGPGLSPRERLWIAVLAAYPLVAAGSADAQAQLDVARQLETKVMGERDVRQFLAYGLVAHLRTRGAFGSAIQECRAAVDKGLSGEFPLVEAGLLLSAGDAEGARSMAAKLVEASPVAAVFGGVIEARSLRHQYRCDTAAASTRRAVAAAEAAPNVAPAAAWLRAFALLESGKAAATLLLVRDARTAFADAARLFEEADDLEAAATCHLQEAVLLMNGLGRLRAAGVALDHATRTAPEGGEAALLTQLTRAELAYRLGDRLEAEFILERVQPADPGAAPPTRLTAIAVASLAFGKQRDRDLYASRLAQGLGQVEPPAARLQLVARLISCPALDPRSAAVKQLYDMVIPAGGWDSELARLSVRDRAVLRLRAAVFARIRGDYAGARSMLGASLREFHDGEAPLIGLREALHLARLLDSADLIAEAGPEAVRLATNEADKYPLLAAAVAIECLEAAQGTGADLGADPAALRWQVDQWLASGGSSAEDWRARLAKLFAMATETDAATADSYLRAAGQLYSTAGNKPAAEEVQNLVAGPDHRQAPDEPKILVELMLSQGTIKTKLPGRRPRLRRPRAPVSRPIRESLAQWVQGPGYDPYPPELPDLMVGHWREFKQALADLIGVPEMPIRRKRAPGGHDLAICVHDGALQPIPWELACGSRKNKPLSADFRRVYRPPSHAAPDTRLTRMVQAGLNLTTGSKLDVDGVSGPDTARALDVLRAKPDSPFGEVNDPETVQRLHEALLLGAQPSVVLVQGWRRSLILERRYARVGFETHTVDQAQIPGLPFLLSAQPPPVIVHVVGGLVTTIGATAIDIQDNAAGWSTPDEAGLLTPADLDRALRAVTQNWPAPVVVLDVPLPTGHREAADQLLLRNCFAADLFALGGTRAVVGTGLADRPAADLAQGILLEGLARGDAIGDVIQAMRREGPPSDFQHFASSTAFAATALWSHDPSMRLPSRGNP